MLVSARALTVFVVGHNDSQKLLATINRIYNALTVTVEDFSIIVFDDGSTDDILAVAKPSGTTWHAGLREGRWRGEQLQRAPLS